MILESWSIEVDANASHPTNKKVTMSDPMAFGTGDGPATTSSNPSTDLAATTYSMICFDISYHLSLSFKVKYPPSRI